MPLSTLFLVPDLAFSMLKNFLDYDCYVFNLRWNIRGTCPCLIIL